MNSDAQDIIIRPYKTEDRLIIDEILRDRDAQAFLMSHPERSLSDGLTWIKRRQEDKNCIFSVAASKNGKQAIGFVQLSRIHWLDRHGYGGVAIGTRWRGEGYGRNVMRLFLNNCFSRLGMNKVILEIRSDNEVAIRLYKSLKFSCIGEMKRHYNDGVSYFNVLLMELVREDRD